MEFVRIWKILPVFFLVLCFFGTHGKVLPDGGVTTSCGHTDSKALADKESELGAETIPSSGSNLSSGDTRAEETVTEKSFTEFAMKTVQDGIKLAKAEMSKISTGINQILKGEKKHKSKEAAE